MEKKPSGANSKFARWLFPNRGNLHAAGRIVLALISNIALLVYILPQKDHLFDVRDYRYVQMNLKQTFLMAAIPLIVLIILLPALRSSRPVHRWLAIGLSICPICLSIAEWFQLLSF